jgi:hypothetical protein
VGEYGQRHGLHRDTTCPHLLLDVPNVAEYEVVRSQVESANRSASSLSALYVLNLDQESAHRSADAGMFWTPSLRVWHP